jgi:hypothetical protein
MPAPISPGVGPPVILTPTLTNDANPLINAIHYTSPTAPFLGDDPLTANRRLAFFTVDAPVRVASGPVVPRASASVHPSRIVTVLSCNTRKGFCSWQVRASEQSAHRRYCVTLTQGSKASGPSISRTTLPKEISSARLANWYPPFLPRRP